jgi:hypothetical protein
MLVFKILKTVALVFIFSFILQLSTIVFANDCQSNTPISTVPGNRVIPPNWRDAYKPKIYSDNDEIARNNYVHVWVDSDGKACPPYSWSVSGTGFHFDSASGPITATTNVDLETLQLWADGTACGPATITVTDLCEGNDEEYLRCTNGRWVKKNINICIMKGAGTLVGSGSYYRDTELIVGYKKQTQRTRYNGGGSGFDEEQDAWDACNTYFSNYCEGYGGCINCENCIDPKAEPGQDWEMPCRVWWDTPPNKWRYTHRCLLNFEYTNYYEWECQ